VQHYYYKSDPIVVATVMLQGSLKTAMKLWGKDAWSEAEAEILQLQ
jgi:hypothetical protein